MWKTSSLIWSRRWQRFRDFLSPMNLDWIRDYCMSLPHARESLQWGDSLVCKVAGKMFAVLNLDPGRQRRLSFKCTPEKFYELTEMPGIVPSPYLARSHWVAVEQMSALRSSEWQDLIRVSYELVFAKLPKRVQAELSSTQPRTSNKTKMSVGRTAARKPLRNKVSKH
jgi:predicted DNA-binding protein (MmcQ/YjbR family)